MPRGGGALLLVLAWALAACSGGTAVDAGDAAAAGDGGSYDLDADRLDAETAWAAVVCDHFARCAPDIFSLFPDKATCISRIAAANLEFQFGRGSVLSPDQVRACSAAAPTDCAAWNRFFMENQVPDACKTPNGTLADGSACASADQCASGACLSIPRSVPTVGSIPSWCGTCGHAADDGGSCGGPGDCKPGLGCVAGTCQPYRDLGESCGLKVLCHPWLRCANGICAAAGLEGDACSASPECSNNPMLACHPSKRTCVPVLWAGTDGACGWSDSGYTACRAGHACMLDLDPSNPAPPGTCIALRAPGEPCVLSGRFGPEMPPGGCLPPANCTDGVCQYENPAACDQVPYPP